MMRRKLDTCTVCFHGDMNLGYYVRLKIAGRASDGTTGSLGYEVVSRSADEEPIRRRRIVVVSVEIIL